MRIISKKTGFKFFAGISIAVLLAAAIFAGCAGAKPVQREAGRAYELVLLHTNDHHGTVLPNNGQGGLAERAAFIKQVRAANQNVLLLDAGDINTGSALSNLYHAEPDILAYNYMGYDAVVFGNHEFDGTKGKLDEQIKTAQFPFVSSNIKTADGKFLGGHQYLVFNYEGFRIGVIGITTLRTLTIASPDRSLNFLNEIDAARDAVSLLKRREKADIIIALTHIGDVQEYPDHITSIMLAEAVPEIDIIIDGHSHSFFDVMKIAGSAYIVSAHEWGKFVGEGKLTIIDGSIANFDWKPVEISSNFPPDEGLNKVLEPFIAGAEASLKEIVGEASDTFVFGNRLTRYQETSIGNLVTDANVWFLKNVSGQEVDFVFHNGGNIRAELPKGQLTREQILTVLPFENYLFVVSLSGRELLEFFDFVATIPQGAGGFPQFSKEVRYTIDVPNQRITNLTINGDAVNPEKNYRFCTNDYLVSGGDGYEVLTKAGDIFNTSQLLSYVVIEYIAAHDGIITPMIDGRMNVIGGVNP